MSLRMRLVVVLRWDRRVAMARCMAVGIRAMVVMILRVAFGAAMVSKRHADPAGCRCETLQRNGERDRQQHDYAKKPGAHGGILTMVSTD
jgi:hypothetical protein